MPSPLLLAWCDPAQAAWPSSGTRFADVSVPYYPRTWAAFVDVDGDGFADLIPSGEDTVLWGDGGPPDQWQGTNPLPTSVRYVAAADLDGDGRPDLVTQDGWWQNLRGGVFRQRGPGLIARFVEDLDGDGDQDLVGSSGYWEHVPTADAAGRRRVVDFGWYDIVGFVDFDGDGDLDFLLSDSFSLSLVENRRGQAVATGAVLADDGFGVAVADFDGDGRPELANVSRDRVRVTELTSTGFGSTVALRGSPPWWTYPPFAADLDSDGDLDLVFGDEWYEQGANGLLAAAVLVPNQVFTGAFDLDGDGDIDLLDDDAWFENTGIADADADGLSDAAEVLWGTDPANPDSDGDLVPDGAEARAGRSPTDPTDADRDEDGVPDDVEAQHGTDPLRGDSDGDRLFDGIELAVGTDPLLADTDGDGFADGEERHCGSDAFDPRSFDTDCDHLDDLSEAPLGTDARDADSDGDGLRDGAELRVGTDALDWDSDDGGTSDGDEIRRGGLPNRGRDDWPAHVVSLNAAVRGMGVGDFDADGDLDVALVQRVGVYPGQVDLFVRLDGQPDGSFAWADTGFVPEQAYDGYKTVAVADVDGDGLDDVVTDHAWIPGPLVGAAAVPLAGEFGVPGDVDGDGDVDVVSIVGLDLVLEENLGAGVFAPPTTLLRTEYGTHPGLGDLDLDGDLDVFAVDSTRNAVVLENLGAATFAVPVVLGTTGLADVVDWLVEDLDRDGVPEVFGVEYDTRAAAVQFVGGVAVPVDRGWFLAGDLDGVGDLDRVYPKTTEGRSYGARWAAGGLRGTRPLGDALFFPTLRDFDGDGDLDVLGATSLDIFWLENRLRP